MRKLILIPAALLAAALLSTAVDAQDMGGEGGGWHHHHHGGALMHELHELNLSDSQKATIKSMFQVSRAQQKAQFESLIAQHQALETATPGTAAYESATTSLASAAAAMASAHVQAEAALRTQIFGVLSDTQKAQLATLQAQHQAKVAAWMASHGRPAN